MNHQTLISVFTPTYNRGNSIRRVYDSLKNQSYKHFQWILIDDGSTDNTEAVVQRILAEKTLTIHHIRFSKNMGKHIAHNKAIEIASGELFTVVDSDDEIEPYALEYANDTWLAIPDAEKRKLSGMYFGCKMADGSSHSSNIGADCIVSNDIDLVYKSKLSGDRWAVRRSEIFRKYPFPADFEGHFFPEGIIWKRIGAAYDIKVYSKELYIIHYDTPDGLTRGKRTLETSAKYVCVLAADHLNNYLKYGKYRPLLFVEAIVRFFVYSFFTRNPVATWKTLNRTAKTVVLLFLPVGLFGLIFFFILRVYRKMNGTSPFSVMAI